MLQHTPCFNEIYNSFKSEIKSFRLIRRKAHTSYGLHNDKTDLGLDVKRFQIPIVTNSDCWFFVTDYDEIEEGWTSEGSSTMLELGRRFEGHHQCYQLEAGTMYHFDVTKIHTMFNDGDSDRVTLIIDVKINDWLLNFIESFVKYEK